MNAPFPCAQFYLATGMVVLVAAYIAYKSSNDPDSWPSAQEVVDGNPHRNRLWMIFLSQALLPFLVAAGVVIAWPLALWMWGEHCLQLRKQRQLDNYPDFTVRSNDLVARCEVAEVERRERVVDPLHAVPDVPFGHLNPAWKAFLGLKGEGEALWSFRARWVDRWGRVELHVGYVWVADKLPKCYFRTEHGALQRQ